MAARGAPTVGSLLTAGRLDVVGVVVTGALVAGYLLGRRRVPRWPWSRDLSYGLGVLTWAECTLGWVGAYATVLQWVRMVQILAVLTVCPTLLLLGRPASLAVAGRPALAPRWLRLRDSPPLRALSHPLLSPLLLPVVTVALVFTPLAALTVRSTLGLDLSVLVLLGLGCCVALPLSGEGTPVSSDGYGLALAVGLVELLVDAIPGIVLTLSTRIQAGGYWSRTHPGYGPTPHGDQHLAGAVLWGVAELVDIPFLALLFARWVRADATAAAAADAAADVLDATRRVVDPRPVGDGDHGDADHGDDDPDGQPPWWVTDPSRLGAARSRRLRD